MNEKKIACACHNVTYGAIRDAVRNGATTLDDVIAATGAGKACGKCKEFLSCFIRDCLNEKDS